MTNYFLHVLQSNEGHKEVPYHGGAIFHLSSLHPFPFIEPLILRTQQVHTPKGTNKQTNQPAPCPEAANQAATYRFPSEQISPCTHKNFFFPVRTQNHHILRKVWCHMWRQCASNKQMVLYMIDTKKMYLWWRNGPRTNSLSLFFKKKKTGPGICRDAVGTCMNLGFGEAEVHWPRLVCSVLVNSDNLTANYGVK